MYLFIYTKNRNWNLKLLGFFFGIWKEKNIDYKFECLLTIWYLSSTSFWIPDIQGTIGKMLKYRILF